MRVFAASVVVSCVVLGLEARAQVFAQNEQGVRLDDWMGGDVFGQVVAMDGAVAVVGAPGRDGGLSDEGAAYVLGRAGNTWSFDEDLISSDPIVGGAFGAAVDVCGDTIVVGAPNERGLTFTTGVVYVFVRSGSVWSEQARLFPVDGFAGDEFGAAVSVFGDRLLIGAPGNDEDAQDAGTVYVFGRFGTSWQETNKLLGNSGAPLGDRFGAAVDLRENTAAIGAPGADPGGFLYVFESDGSGLTQTRRLQVGGQVAVAFAESVVVGTDVIVASSPDEAQPGVYTTVRDGTTWSPLTKFEPDDVVLARRFGNSLALDQQRLLVGAPGELNGAVHVFDIDAQRTPCWRGVLGIPMGLRGYGTSVAISDERALVGVPGAGVGAQLERGLVIFSRPVLPHPRQTETTILRPAAPTTAIAESLDVSVDRLAVGIPSERRVLTWTRDQGVWSEGTPVTLASQATFGASVALDGGTLAVAPSGGGSVQRVRIYEANGTAWSLQAVLKGPLALDGTFGAAMDLEGNRLLVGDEGRSECHLYERAGTAWNDVAFFSGDGAFDDFGGAVAIDGDTVLVGARNSDLAANNNGAAFVYTRSGTAWIQQAVLLPSTTNDFDFGSRVVVDGDTAAVGHGGTTGSVHVFVRTGTVWTQEQRISVPVSSFQFSMSLDQDRLVYAAPAGSGGAAFVYRRVAGQWGGETELNACVSAANFGRAATLQGDEAFVLGQSQDVYLFELDPQPFASFCDDADGSLAACPCANPGSPDSGCEIQQGTGGVRLDVLAQTRGNPNRATLIAEGFAPTSTPASIVLRSRTLDQGTPVVFGDGVRCVGPQVVRVETAFGVGGVASYLVGHGADTGDYFYQVWFRNQPAMFCTPEAFNLSNGRILSW